VCISAVSAQRLESFGLDGMRVTSLSSVNPTFGSSHGTFLIAGTDSFGIFIRDLSTADSDWISFGLEGKRITSVYSYYWEIGPTSYSTLFAGVEPNINDRDSTVLYQYTQEVVGRGVPSYLGLQNL
jgi:hypothetical protein